MDCQSLVRLTSELGYYGCMSGGFIYSYGDMMANFAGLQLWGRMVGNSSDKYISCGTNGRFEINPASKAFSFADYVSPFWDEAVNCSMDCAIEDRFRPSQEVPVMKRIGKYSCPYPQAKFSWAGEATDGEHFCKKASEDYQAHRPIFPAGFLGGSGCLEEVVSPTCLQAAEAPTKLINKRKKPPRSP
jgi:hypothetical protein